MDFQTLLTTLIILTQLVITNAEEYRKRNKRAVEDIQSCSSMIYCQGNLLDTVQRLRIYPDSKTFVDMVQLNEENVTLRNFENMLNSTNNQPTRNDVVNFIDQNFLLGNETEYWTPTDFTDSPKFLDKIQDATIKNFAKKLVSLWPQLGRRIKNDVKENPGRYSIIPVPEGFIVPGGRFREIYYWDSYWIIKGLLLSEMKVTARGMLENLAYFIKTYGFIPNGSRIYYLNRSQPPLFTLMVGLYMEYTNNVTWLRSNVEYMETELLWWINHRTVNITKDGITYQLAHYAPKSNTPRPESYAEDLTTCSYFETEDLRKNCYKNLKAAAETGWDFSTRWIFDTNGTTNANITRSDPERLIPADLNAYLYKSFKLLSEFYKTIGNPEKYHIWGDYANLWNQNIQALLYNETDGIWYDLDKTLLKQRKLFFPSNFAPLWTECYDLTKREEYGRRAAKYFQDQKINMYLGGIPTSLEDSGEQWDMPNAWPHLQDIVITGLYKTGNAEAKNIAEIFANRWIASNLKGFNATGFMYEKYDAIEPGLYGSGGEYSVQLGFGWSNGVALSLIEQFSSGGMPAVVLNPFILIILLSLCVFL